MDYNIYMGFICYVPVHITDIISLDNRNYTEDIDYDIGYHHVYTPNQVIRPKSAPPILV